MIRTKVISEDRTNPTCSIIDELSKNIATKNKKENSVKKTVIAM